jgi:hypothetical protein
VAHAGRCGGAIILALLLTKCCVPRAAPSGRFTGLLLLGVLVRVCFVCLSVCLSVCL